MVRPAVRFTVAALVAVAVAGTAAVARQAPDDDLPEPFDAPVATVDALVDGFDGDRVAWRFETADAPFRERAHELSDAEAIDEGGQSERFRFVAGIGSAIYFSYPLPRVPLSEDLTASVRVRSDRPGAQLLGRVVLPRDIDPETNQPFYVIVAGTLYESTGRWQALELAGLPVAVERQVRLLRAKVKRPIRMDGAYLERLVLNVYGGSGETEVLVDDLRVAPVPADLIAEAEGPAEDEADAVVASGPNTHADGRIRFESDVLSLLDEPTRRYAPWVPTIIDAPGADIEALRRHGFDVYAVGPGADAGEVAEAADAGFLLMPMLGEGVLGPADAQRLLSAAGTFPRRESVAFWHLGSDLGGERTPKELRANLDRVRGAVSALHKLEPPIVSRLATADVTAAFPLYARQPGRLDVLGASGMAWGTMTQPLHYRYFLSERRDLTALDHPRALFRTWIPAAVPAVVGRNIWGDDAPPSWGRPQLMPEQVRQAACMALSSGYRAIGVRGDAELTRAAGEARLIELALLNAEIDLFQAILADPAGPLPVYRAFPPSAQEKGRPINHNFGYAKNQKPEDEPGNLHQVLTVAFPPTPDRRGTLLLVTNLEWNSQWVPPQLARRDLTIRVPGIVNASAWEVGLGGVRNLTTERVPGGTEVLLDELGVTSWILLTSDVGVVRQLEQAIAANVPKAAELAIAQAEAQLRDALDVHSRLVLDGHTVRNADDLIGVAEDQLRSAKAALARGEAAAAFANARRVCRPLELLLRTHYDHGMEELRELTEEAFDLGEEGAMTERRVKLMVTPTSAPPLTCANTLPQLFIWTDAMRSYPFGRNLLVGGDFERADPAVYAEEGWSDASPTLDGLQRALEIEPAPEAPGRPPVGRRVLRLRIAPEEGRSPDEFPPAPPRETVAIRTPPIRVRRHEFLRISVLAFQPRPQPPSSGGLIVRDSIGGAPLQCRLDKAVEWTRIVLYRRAPEDGELTITLGLAASGGEVYFDDLRVERAEQPGGAIPSPGLAATPIPDEPAAAAPSRTAAGPPPAAPRR